MIFNLVNLNLLKPKKSSSVCLHVFVDTTRSVKETQLSSYECFQCQLVC